MLLCGNSMASLPASMRINSAPAAKMDHQPKLLGHKHSTIQLQRRSRAPAVARILYAAPKENLA